MRVQRWVGLLACAALAATIVAPAEAHRRKKRGTDARERAVAASRYIAVNQTGNGAFKDAFSPVGSAADAVLSLVAVRRGPDEIDDALEYIEANLADVDESLGLKAKVVMAVTAGGLDPRAFGGRDLVAEIRATLQPDGQFGTHTPEPGNGEVFDHALALLGLAAAGESLISDTAYSWLLNAQCEDGGWQFDDPPGPQDDKHCYAGQGDFFRSDTNSTSYAVQALASASDARFPEFNPLAYFESMRDPIKKGWGYDASFPLTDANSTALVIQAYAASERPPPRGSVRALKRLQYPLCGPNSGAFAFTFEPSGDRYRRTEPNVGATIGAVLGLLRRPLPIAVVEVTKEAPGASRCKS